MRANEKKDKTELRPNGGDARHKTKSKPKVKSMRNEGV